MVPFWICPQNEGKWVNIVGANIILDWLCILIMYCKIPENLLMQNDVSSFDN